MKRAAVPPGFVFSSIAAMFVLLSPLPGTAGAATQVGQVSPANPTVCSPGSASFVHRVVPPYAVPSPGGVITRWSHRGIFLKEPALPGTPRAGSGRLQVWHFVALPRTFNLVGRSEPETFTPGVETTYSTRIPVSSDDVLGMRAEERTGCFYVPAPAPGAEVYHANVDPAPGSLVPFTDPPIYQGFGFNVSAILEPDADGFGDETQDGCPGQAGPAENSGCPPGTPPPAGGGDVPGGGSPSNEFSFGKLKKNKRNGTAKLTVEVPGPGDLALTETDKLKGSLKHADAAGDEKLAIKPTGKAKRKLNRRGKAKLDAEVTYTPELGASNTDSKSVKLKKR